MLSVLSSLLAVAARLLYYLIDICIEVFAEQNVYIIHNVDI